MATKPGEKDAVVLQAEVLMNATMKRCVNAPETTLPVLSMMLIAAGYALQVARGDEDIQPPQAVSTTKAEGLRAVGLGFIRS
ncbi:hypothetical protein [Cryobacterium zhongshanensis]|uniref:Uncharacterized protein n=1 Tax=Cryobacterium zhongshanensis TaxID=2928153 RepID=A0AA41QWT8_9MICO|nr:hypothetical protein [Cryobacterium zhongshanensis]MCI4659605.1 hypothetical protein [Cryobacterium zhongshanensis]